MNDARKSKTQLIAELGALRQQIGEWERLGAVSRLLDSQELFNSFMDNNPAVAFMKDAQGRYVYVNKTFEHIFGIKSDLLKGQKDDFYLPPETVRQVGEHDREVLSTGRPLEIIESVPTPDGREHHWLVVKFPFTDHAGEKYVGGVAVEITERKRTEEDLLRSRDELKSEVVRQTQELTDISVFYNLSDDLFFVGSFDGLIKRVNPAIKSLGYEPQSVLGKPLYQFCHSDDREVAARAVETLAGGKEIHDLEVRAVSADGGLRWMLWNAFPVPDRQVFYAIGRNIDVRKRAEDELRKSEELHRQILDACADMILSKDPSHRIVYANKAFRDFYGMSMEELQGIIDAPFNAPGHTEQYLADDEYVISTGRTLNIRQEPVTRHDGKVMLFHTIKSPIFSADGQVVQSVGVSRDITEHRLQEEKIERLNQALELRVDELARINAELESLTRKLEQSRDQALESSKLKSEFVANISHEIRTPITGVIGMTELLSESSLTDEQRTFTAAIRESADSLLTIINDILDFSKMEAGKIELESLEFSILSLVENSTQLLASTARAKNLSLMNYVDPRIPPVLVGDSIRLRQILLNLASNAVKFTERGDVVVRADLIDDSDLCPEIRFSVIDTGIGLSPEDRKRLFEPFAQADGSTTRKYGGTGLGLSICKRLVEIMGGTIGVESEKGAGSTFWFSLRLKKPESAAGQGVSHLRDLCAGLADLRVLVVTDNPTQSAIISDYLASAGITPESCRPGPAAIERLERAVSSPRPYDAVIVDATGPDHEGERLLESLDGNASLKDLGIVRLFRFDAPRGAVDAHERGVHLNKPVRLLELMESLARATKRNFVSRSIGQACGQETMAPPPVTPLPDGFLVLVAEDNPVLQELAICQLKKLGINAHAASNGYEVLQAIKGNRYSLILMDCQMPEMDGFEATAVIRKSEAETGQHTPIVAMTASAMQGDREHCLTTGMDDYLSKPVSIAQLRQVLERWMSGLAWAGTDSPRPAGTEAAETSVIDLAGLSESYGEKELAEIFQLFLREASQLLSDLDAEVLAGNRKRVAEVAHQLKGLAAVMAAGEMESLSAQLEGAARLEDWPAMQKSALALRDAFARVSRLINQMSSQAGS